MRIACNCRTCKSNAATLGLATLRAEVPEKVYTGLGGDQARHSLVWIAHDPSVLGESNRDRLGVTPVGYTHTRHDRPTSLADAKARAEALIAARHA